MTANTSELPTIERARNFTETRRAWNRLKTAWAGYLSARRELRAVRRLQRIVDETRNSFECEQFRRRRAAMLKFTRSKGAS